MSAFRIVVRVVRDPRGLLDDPDAGELARLAPPLFVLLVGSAVVIGLSIGSHHSAEQALYSGIKLPMVLLAGPLLAVPAVAAVGDALGLPTTSRRAAAAGLCAMTRVAVFALAFMPVAWLFSTVAQAYVVTALTTSAHLALAGCFGIGTLLAAFPDLRRAPLLTQLGIFAATFLLFGGITAQVGWLLRPFILMPDLEPALFQPPRSDVFTELWGRLVRPDTYSSL
jgi:cytochrome bd-type quinol oxidase subunit 2